MHQYMYTHVSHGLTGLLFNKITQPTTDRTVVDNGLVSHSQIIRQWHLQHLHDTAGFRDQDPAKQSFALLGNA